MKGNPRLETIEKIADALNVPIASLFHEVKIVEGYISVNGKITRFDSIKELADAFKTTQYGICEKEESTEPPAYWSYEE